MKKCDNSLVLPSHSLPHVAYLFLFPKRLKAFFNSWNSNLNKNKYYISSSWIFPQNSLTKTQILYFSTFLFCYTFEIFSILYIQISQHKLFFYILSCFFYFCHFLWSAFFFWNDRDYHFFYFNRLEFWYLCFVYFF